MVEVINIVKQSIKTKWNMMFWHENIFDRNIVSLKMYVKVRYTLRLIYHSTCQSIGWPCLLHNFCRKQISVVLVQFQYFSFWKFNNPVEERNIILCKVKTSYHYKAITPIINNNFDTELYNSCVLIMFQLFCKSKFVKPIQCGRLMFMIINQYISWKYEEH